MNPNKTDSQQYLHIKSDHPKPWKDSQAIFIKSVNSNQVNLNNSCKKVKQDFIK